MTGLALAGPEPSWEEHLHVRMIALENLVVALLAGASDNGHGQARKMASCISPRPGFIHHTLMTHATGHMLNPVERAVRLCVWRPA